jgi:hypothetical protein
LLWVGRLLEVCSRATMVGRCSNKHSVCAWGQKVIRFAPWHYNTRWKDGNLPAGYENVSDYLV